MILRTEPEHVGWGNAERRAIGIAVLRGDLMLTNSSALRREGTRRRFPTRRRDEMLSASRPSRSKIEALTRNIGMTGYLKSLCAMLAIANLISPTAALAREPSVFKCIDSEGRVAFQDVPCKPTQHETQVAIDPAPPVSASPDYARPRQHQPEDPQSSRSRHREAVVYSFECRTRSGALFYRHDRCPASIDRSGRIGGRRSASREAVSARRMPREQACRGMRSVGRDGREFDDEPSTYERNLGRDPCRRY
jgi:hypothetical protein